MTPFWRAVVKQSLASKHPAARLFGEGLIRAHHCFDLTSVEPLIRETANELRGARDHIPGHLAAGAILDLGERVVFPAESFWLEWGRVGVLAMGWQKGGDTGVAMLLVTERRDAATGIAEPIWSRTSSNIRDQLMHLGHLVERGDGLFAIVPPSPAEAASPEVSANAVPMLFRCFAALALINSPAAQRAPVEAHRGLEKTIRAVDPKAPATRASKIVLRVGDRAAGPDHPATSSPRAYHFCRAHSRTRMGKPERVRAHWRGDPAFGIRISSYSVKP